MSNPPPTPGEREKSVKAYVFFGFKSYSVRITCAESLDKACHYVGCKPEECHRWGDPGRSRKPYEYKEIEQEDFDDFGE